MRIEGTYRLEHPRQAVWAALMDPGVLAGTLPGCERLERVGEDTFEGRLRVSIGPVRGDFQGRLTMSEAVAPESYRMQLDGRGPNGFMTGAGTVRLEEADGGEATVVHYDLEAQVGGKIAGLGQRLLESSGKAVAQQGLEGLERQLAALHDDEREGTPEQISEGGENAGEAPGAEAAAAAGGRTPAPGAGSATSPPLSSRSSSAGTRASFPRPPAAPPSQIEFAAGVARQVLRDLVPPESRRYLLAGASFVAGLLLGFWMGRKR